MNKLVKLLFLVTLVFIANVGFATGDEALRNAMMVNGEKLAPGEELELLNTLLSPITTNFTDKSSLTKLLSNKIIESQINAKRAFTIDAIGELVEKVKADPEFNDENRKVIDDAISCTSGSSKSELFARKYIKNWQNSVANCRDYVDLVLIAFNFNMMNIKAQGKIPRFQGAVYIKTIGDTGDHGLVLVQGKSGYVFVVDPWLRKIINLGPDFFEFLTDMDNEKLNVLPDAYNLLLNRQLGTFDKDTKKTYYDVLYVGPKTKWTLDRVHTSLLYTIAHTRDDYMQAFYEDANIGNAFRGSWVTDYRRLLMCNASETTSECKQ